MLIGTFKQVVVKINFFLKKNGYYNIKIPADPSSHSTLDQEGLAKKGQKGILIKKRLAEIMLIGK